MFEASLADSAARTANGNGLRTRTDNVRGVCAFFLDVTAQSGTTPTLDVDIEVRDPLSGKWAVLASFTQVGAATGLERITAEIHSNTDITGFPPLFRNFGNSWS